MRTARLRATHLRATLPPAATPARPQPPLHPHPPTRREALWEHSTSLRLDLQDVADFDADLGAAVEAAPAEYLPLVGWVEGGCGRVALGGIRTGGVPVPSRP